MKIATPKPKLIRATKDFRMYEPIVCKGWPGRPVQVQLCEAFDPKSCQYEPFYSAKSSRGNEPR